ncbi:MAG: hypothetical protein DME43_02270 [Verrucomicrobia bacterium]|nr:MAG: hypothetical protein DME43_02270 [Verrucomicrobiota bacterium]
MVAYHSRKFFARGSSSEKNLESDDHFDRPFLFMAMKGTYRIMKNKLRNLNITKNRMRVALLLVLATSIIVLAPAFSTSARAGSFSINDVSGNYVWHAEGWDLGGTNGKQSVPLSAVGIITYTPATGTFHVDLILRVDGTNLHNLRDGTYTVDATGHGTMTWLSGSGNVKQIDFYIVKGGAELKWIDTDPPGTIELSTIGTMTKQ